MRVSDVSGTPVDVSDAVFSIVSTPTIPEIAVNHRQLYFCKQAGNGTATGAQIIKISNAGAGTLVWQTTPSVSWLACTPQSGTQTGQVSVSLNAGSLVEGVYQGVVAIADTSNSAVAPQYVQVQLTVVAAGSGAAPFGSFDTPANGTTGVTGSIGVTGWALDDMEVVAVKIYRDPVTGETAGSNGKVFIGDAVFSDGARPDVEQLYPNLPLSSRAGWGYMMLTNFLPNQGNGTFTLHAYVTDREGHTVTLGARRITCNNATANLPFGAIDTPAQGGTVSGASYVNFGWALTPQPGIIPTDGSTINVWVDGAPLGHPVYNQYRSDIATLFPGYANSNGAVGYFYLDTTTFTNAIHTIAWSVEDSLGRISGIGSRYFQVLNEGAASGLTSASVGSDDASRGTSMGSYSSTALVAVVPEADGGLAYRCGLDPQGEFVEMPAGLGDPLTITLRGLDRLELVPFVANNSPASYTLGGRSETMDMRACRGYLKVGDELRELPIGGSLDRRSGRFCWIPGPGFLGEYPLVFVRREADGREFRREVTVRVLPQGDGTTGDDGMLYDLGQAARSGGGTPLEGEAPSDEGVAGVSSAGYSGRAAYVEPQATPPKGSAGGIVTTWYLWSYDGKLMAECDTTGACAREYVYLGDRLAAEYL
ncbi:MAG TPA: hypothetical protein PKK12_10255, partial [Candidatus Aminicenantes bacterium]|nr:hypothetical protein [Candidatus Aminicenantes bacterium]